MEIQNATLQKFSNNVQEMVDFMEASYKEIVALSFMHLDYTMHLFNALLTSKHDIFCSMVQRLKDTREIDEHTETGILIKSVVTKYNNMVKRDTWDQKVPKGAKMLAVTTKLEVLESAFNTASKTPYKGGTGGGGVSK